MAATGVIGGALRTACACGSVSNPNIRSSFYCQTSGSTLRSASAWPSTQPLTIRTERKAGRREGRGREGEEERGGIRAEVRSEQKVPVVLGPYKDGALKVSLPARKVTEEDIEKALKEKIAKKYVLERVNFTGSGAKIGHTVRLRFEGKYAEGPNAGQTIKGTKTDSYELELKEREEEPWKTFVHEITKAGMGQEESKTFVVQFPSDYKAKTLAGVKARFTATITEIGVMREVETDTRSLEEQREGVEKALRESAQRVADDIIDTQIRTALLASSQADVEKVAASVTWAKFGERSLQDFKWNVLQEEVARVEKIPFDQVSSFLRSQAVITYT